MLAFALHAAQRQQQGLTLVASNAHTSSQMLPDPRPGAEADPRPGAEAALRGGLRPGGGVGSLTVDNAGTAQSQSAVAVAGPASSPGDGDAQACLQVGRGGHASSMGGGPDMHVCCG